jgi:hypothetical protein
VRIGARLCRIQDMNFHEKALFVKSRRGGCRGHAPQLLPFALCFHPHSQGAHTLFGGSVHRMRSVFIRTNRVLQSSERSLLIKGDQVHIAQSP